MENSQQPQAEIRQPDPLVWFGLAVIRKMPDGKRRVRVRWTYALSLFGGLAVVAYLLAALAGYFWFKVHRGFSDERYVDMLKMPFSYAEHDRKIGEYLLKNADDHFKNQRYGEAMQDYRLGLMKVPENLHARQMLAYLYLGFFRLDQLDLAMKVLDMGMPYALANDPNYIKDYLTQLALHHLSARVISVCRENLAKNPTNVAVTKVLALNLLSTLTDEGQFSEADDVIAKYKLLDDFEGVLLNARLMWERGRRHEAVAYLEDAKKRFPHSEVLLQLLTYYSSNLGDLDKAQQYIMERIINSPNDVSPRLERLNILAKSGDKDQVKTESQSILQQFNDQKNLMLLADFAADHGDVALAQTVYERAVENQFDLTSFSVLRIEAQLSIHDFNGAIDFLDELEQEQPDWYKKQKPLFEAMRAVAEYGNGRTDTAEIYLTDIRKNPSVQPKTLVTIASRFQSLGGLEQAEELLRIALRMDPNDQGVLQQLVVVDLQLGTSEDLYDNIDKLLKVHRPPLEILNDAYLKLGSDRFIYVTHREDLLDKIHSFLAAAASRNEGT